MLIINTMATGERIRQLRNEKGITAREMAKQLGISYYVYLKWERGDSMPHIKYLINIAEILECFMEELIVIRRET